MVQALNNGNLEASARRMRHERARTVSFIRHTALMSRLIDGENVDLLMLARNAGTSVDQLERFYLSHADPAMKVGNLHSLKPQPVVEEVELSERRRCGIQIRASLDEPVFS